MNEPQRVLEALVAASPGEDNTCASVAWRFTRWREGYKGRVIVAASTVAVVAVAAAVIVVALVVWYILPRGGRRKPPPRS